MEPAGEKEWSDEGQQIVCKLFHFLSVSGAKVPPFLQCIGDAGAEKTMAQPCRTEKNRSSAWLDSMSNVLPCRSLLRLTRLVQFGDNIRFFLLPKSVVVAVLDPYGVVFKVEYQLFGHAGFCPA